MNKIIFFGGATLLLFVPAGYFLIEYVQERSFVEVLLHGMTITKQVVMGTLYGLLISFLALWIIGRDFFNKERKFYSQLIGQLNLNFAGILFLSLCAGISEEIFFRAGLQPLLGLWSTSIIFVLMHGYFNPYNWRISVYGATMVIFIAGIGYLFREVGLISAMAAHSIFDIVLLTILTKRKP